MYKEPYQLPRVLTRVDLKIPSIIPVGFNPLEKCMSRKKECQERKE